MANRLAKEASPYLLQHAHNPVDWWPWCDEALAEATRRDVPILLSIGYSACHWCHVMERESFEDPATAALMNELFVNVKVDREERPDLDQIYQLVVQLMGRSGGWPLTVFLTPSQKPFFGGTYFPPESRYGMSGFPEILRAIADAYATRRGEVDGQADELTNAISEIGKGKGHADDAPDSPSPDLLARTTSALLRRFDPVHGGFGRAPKFPNTMPLELVLRRGVLEDDEAAKKAAHLQLVSMRRGGIWDHLGGGFHRYSTDERWLVPHFEKMLYDNGLLLRMYADAHRVFGGFEETVRSIATYVAREMTDDEGGFYASQDADSEGEEGKFFVWDKHEMREVLGADAEALIAHYGVTDAGNFEDHGRPTFKTVLFELEPLDAKLEGAREKLFEAREKRPKPFRDEKILTSWNALMIGALAEAGALLDDDTMIAAATKALAFVEKHLVTGDRVARLAKKVDGQWLVKGAGFLDDYAYLANAAIDLYEVTGDDRHFALATKLATVMLRSFYTEKEGFFFTATDGETLITRSQDAYDHAVPSGTSYACRALLRLRDPRFALVAEAELRRLAPAAIENPFAYGQSLCEIDRLVRGSVEITITRPGSGDARAKKLARAVFAKWLPNRTVEWRDGDLGVTVCKDRVCSLPVTTESELLALL